MATTKETIYLEADDEITTVIEKVVNAKNTIIALVLPKRATVFQSVVNMKLLKKAAAEAKRKVVLISSDQSLESIASIAGVHVAKSLTSKPVIPKRMSTSSTVATVASVELDGTESAQKTSQKTAFEERETPTVDSIAKTMGEVSDKLEIDNTEPDSTTDDEVVMIPDEKKKSKFKVPDFGSFRLKLALVIGVIILLGMGWYFGFVVMPKATIAINADTTNSEISFPFTVDTTAKALDMDDGVLPAVKEQIVKENKATVEATGQKDIGDKASGTVSFSMKDCSVDEVTVPSGTVISSNGLSYVTTEEATMQSVKIGNFCSNEAYKQYSTDTVEVVAQQAGENYNRSAGSYSTTITTVSAYGSDMTGGTSQIVKVVSENDIQKAKEQLAGTSKGDASDELKNKIITDGKYPLLETIGESEPVVKTSKAVNEEANDVTVTQTITYTMLGVDKDEILQLLEAAIKESFKDDQTRNIRDNGLVTATYSIAQKASDDIQTLTLETVATIGATFDIEAIKSEVVGKKRGDIEKLLESREGVRSVSVDYSPIWITTTPKSKEKITIVINEVQN